MRVVFVGYAVEGSRTRQRIRAFSDLELDLTVIDTAPPGRTYESRPSLATRIRHRLRRPADETGANKALLAAAGSADVIWIENASMIRPGTLSAVRRMPDRPRLIWYSEDDMMRPRNGSVWVDRAWPLYDLCVTTKSFNAQPDELPAKGASKVLFVNNSYDPYIHKRVPVDAETQNRLGADVSFVGTFEKPRADSMLYLARNGVDVRVWGNGWGRLAGVHPRLRVENRPVYDDDYARVVSASGINLAFLRRANRDVQTTRSIELPACGAFMLHEFSEEMAGLLAPDREAAYFRDDEELLAACRRWGRAPSERLAVSGAGHERVLAEGLRHQDMLERAISIATTDISG